MLKQPFIFPINFRKKLALVALYVSFSAISFANFGDGDGDKLKSGIPAWKNESFAPIKLSESFTLKAGPNFRNTTIFNEEKRQPAPNPNYLQINALVTYQKGNVTYILPRSQRVSVSAGHTSVQAINLKVNIRN